MTGRIAKDLSVSVCLGLAVTALYLLTFSSVPTSDGQSFVWMIDRALAKGKMAFSPQDNISNAPFSFFIAFWAKRAGFPFSTLRTLQILSAMAAGVGAGFLYSTIRLAGCPPFWAVAGAGLFASSYGVWYFANGEVHHAGLAILIVVFYALVRLREEAITPRRRYAALVGLGLLNAVAVFFHQEHFIFGFTAITVLAWGQPWSRAWRAIVVYGTTGSLGTFLLIYIVGRMVVRLQSARDVVAWYFGTILVGAAHDIVLEPARVIFLRVVKGQLAALDFGLQVLADVMTKRVPWTAPWASLYCLVTIAALGLAVALTGGLWSGRRAFPGQSRAIAAGAFTWLISYPALLWWYYPAITEYYLKTLPPLIILVILGGWGLERRGKGSARLIAATLLFLVASTNFSTAILPWYRYGLMRERLARALPTLAGPGALAVSVESGLDPVFAGRVEQLQVKNLLYEQGKRQGFETIRARIAEQVGSGHRVLVYSLVPSRWALEGLADRARNPYQDRYSAEDFVALLAELDRQYRLVPVFEYWEEAKEPLYLFGRHLEPILEVRKR